MATFQSPEERGRQRAEKAWAASIAEARALNIKEPAVAAIPQSVAGLVERLALACVSWLADHPEDISKEARETIQNAPPKFWAGRFALIAAALLGPANLDDFWRMIAQPDARKRVGAMACRELGEPEKKGARRK